MKAAQLKATRIMLDITQTQLAKATGMTQGLIAKIETGYLKTWAKYEAKILAVFEAKRASLLADLEDQKRILTNLF